MASKIKKLSYILLSVIIITAVISLFNYRAKDVSPLQTIDKIQLENVEIVGYSVSAENEGFVTYEKEFNGGFFRLPLNDRPFTILTIELNEPLAFHNSIDLYCTELENGVEAEKCYTFTASNGKDSTRLFVIFQKTTANVSDIKISSRDTISVKSISTYDTSDAQASLVFNPTACTILAITLGILLICEKKLKYYGWILESIRKELCDFEDKSGKPLKALRIVTICVTATFFISCLCFASVSLFSKATVITAFALGSLSVILQIVDKAVFGRSANAAKMFLMVGAIVGVLICFTMPQSTHLAWDDEIHLRQAYTLVHGTDGYISIAQWRLFNYNYLYADYIENASQFIRTMAAENTILIDHSLPSVNLYNCLGYIPMVISIFVSSLLNVDLSKMLLLCHLANLFTYIAIIYLGIKKLKSGGYIAAAIALMPSTLYLACSCNYDFWLTALFFYGTAYVISVYQHPEKRFETLDLIKLLALFFIACGPKPVYCVMFLPLLFLSTSKFKSSKQVWIFRAATVATIILIAIMLVVPAVFVNNLYSDPRGGSNVNGVEQIKYILSQPLAYGFTLLKQMGEYVSLKSFVDYSGGFGYLTGYGANPFAFYGSFAALIIFYCILTDRVQDDLYNSRPMQKLKWISLLTCFLQIVIICTSMYIGYTDVGADHINGCQFRYLFPLMFPILFFIVPRGLKINIGNRLKTSMIFGALSLNLLYNYFITYIIRF